MLTEKFEVHSELNPKLWTSSNELREDVASALYDIIEQFQSTIDIPLKVVDAEIVGSSASYNYTQYSDLDLHLICNFQDYDASKEVLEVLFNALKTKFNSDYNITVKGIEVEIYIQDIHSTTISNGIYSLYQSKWIKFPKPITNIPDVDISDTLTHWNAQIESALVSQDSKRISDLIDKLYLVRKDSLDAEGEFGAGNLLFKEIRNLGLLDKLRSAYKDARSAELTLESLQPLNEDTRSHLISRSKHSHKGNERFKRRVKSKVAATVKEFNSIDMNKLFKKDILTVDIKVQGETDTYIVKISFGGFLELLRAQVKRSGFNLKAVTKALIEGFNQDDVYVHCSCPDWKYRFAYFATKNDINSGTPENIASDITNPHDTLGSACKHVLLVLSNTSWLLKVSSVIHNYVNYMQKHYEKMYAEIIYPAIYGKEYEDPAQTTFFDSDDLDSDSSLIDTSNEYAKTKNRFKKGNTQGVRFAPKPDTDSLLDD